MIRAIVKVIVQIITHLLKRGRGILKILFFIDDFFRLFTMTILIPLFFSWLKFGSTLVTLGVILGLVIDVHDFVSEAGIIKIE
ncbi:hypothetical protein JW930_05820 [Candidatus Woesearchaeota archaeon]|nr:hypothetical protein [Candidatus Woesearchaeota archaeon]